MSDHTNPFGGKGGTTVSGVLCWGFEPSCSKGRTLTTSTERGRRALRGWATARPRCPAEGIEEHRCRRDVRQPHQCDESICIHITVEGGNVKETPLVSPSWKAGGKAPLWKGERRRHSVTNVTSGEDFPRRENSFLEHGRRSFLCAWAVRPSSW